MVHGADDVSHEPSRVLFGESKNRYPRNLDRHLRRVYTDSNANGGRCNTGHHGQSKHSRRGARCLDHQPTDYGAAVLSRLPTWCGDARYAD